ncbi:hypothetical protein DFH28DRAFT_883735 [Melampsora americana]|nr:hypothetical protein DFH28DRAFT_883735 [Melampsora americana]
MFLFFAFSKGAIIWMIIFQTLQNHSAGMAWGLSTDSRHFQLSGPQRIEPIQKPRRLVKRTNGFMSAFKPIRKAFRSKSMGCVYGGTRRERVVGDTPRVNKNQPGKVTFTIETPNQGPARERSSSFSASPAPHRKFNRSSSIGSFMRHTKPDKIVNDALESKKKEAIEETGKDEFVLLEEPRAKSQQETPMSNLEYEPLLRTFKTVQPISNPKPKPKVGILNALKGGLEKILIKLAEITISLCQGVSKLIRRNKVVLIDLIPNHIINFPNHVVGNPATDTASAAGPAAINIRDDMKILGWELILNPSKRDTVIFEIAEYGERFNRKPNKFMARFLDSITQTLKKKLEKNIPKWVNDDINGRSKIPDGWDEYVKSLSKSKQEEITEVSEKMFEEIAEKIPTRRAHRVGQMAREYKNQRLGIVEEVVESTTKKS